MSLLAGSPGECCVRGFKHEGAACGQIKNVGGTSTYVAQPKNHNGKGIVFCTDAFGHNLINNQLLADQFAENGFAVLMPDLFHGNPAPEKILTEGMGSFDIMGWVKSHQPEEVDKIVAIAVQALRNDFSCKTVGAVGYCFGSRYVVRFADGKHDLEAGVINHPSFVTEDEFEAATQPLSLQCAETDGIFPVDNRHKAEEILAKNKVVYQFSLYSHVSHGFAVKADLSDKRQRFAKESAFLAAVNWFNAHA